MEFEQTKLLYSYACIIERFSRFKPRRGKQAEINAENDGGACGNGEGGEGDGSPSAYLNLNGNDEVIHYHIYHPAYGLESTLYPPQPICNIR